MTVQVHNETVRRRAVMGELSSLLDRHNLTQQNAGLPPIESAAGSTDARRLDHVEGLVRTMRGSLQAVGEVSAPVVLAAGAQLIAWAIALEERDEARIYVEDAA